VFALLVVMLSPGLAHAQQTVPFVPTPNDVADRMLSMAKVGQGDYVIDLGSGDGRIVRLAARRYGARGFGVDIDRELVDRSNELARRDGVADRASFMVRDLFETDVSDATVLTLYLLPETNLRLRPRLFAQLRPGTRVVAHDFDLGDWPADETVRMHSPDKYGGSGGDSTIRLWIVPANAAGRWQWRLTHAGQPVDYELDATQRFQSVSAAARVAGREARIEDAKLDGDRLTFTLIAEVRGALVRHAFDGRIQGDTIAGSVALSGPRIQGSAEWAAVRGASRSGSIDNRNGRIVAVVH